MIEIVPLDSQHLPALRRFAGRVWQRPAGDDFMRWRYEASASFHHVWLAMRDGECLATEAAIRRPWRVEDEVTEVLEVFDWYCLPELRNSGLGVRVMQALMKQPHPLLLVGGTADTQGLLPRLKWHVTATVERFSLPLGRRRLAEALVQRFRVPRAVAGIAAAAALARPGHRPRRRKVPAAGRAVALCSVGPETLALYDRPTSYRSVPLWTAEILRWLTGGFPTIGHFVPLSFFVGGQLVGWALLRIYPTATGSGAEIVECFAPQPEAGLHTWMVSEVATVAAGFGVEALHTQTACPSLRAALVANHFVRSGSNPVQIFWPGRDALPGPIAAGSNTNDNALVPWSEGLVPAASAEGPSAG